MPELPNALATAFAQQGAIRSYQKNTYLFHEGDSAAELYLLHEGAIEIDSISPSGNRRLVTTLTPPRVFGELAVLGDIERTASALALTDVRVSALRASEFLALVDADQTIGRSLLRSLARHVAAHESHIDDLLFLDLRGRVAKRLLDLAGDQPITSAITQADLASLCGGSRENVTRILSDLQKRGFVEKTGRRYKIIARSRLEKLSRG